MPLLENFAAQSNNRKKGICLCLQSFASPGCSTWFMFKHFLLVLRSTTIWWSFCSIDARASNDDGQASSRRCVKRHLHIHRKFSPDRTKRKTKGSPMRRETTFYVSWCCVTGFYRPGLVESLNRSERTKGPCACHGTVLFFESKDHGRLSLEKILWTSLKEENARYSLDISLFCRGGGGGGGERDKKRLPKAAPGRSVVGSKSDYDAASRFVWRVLLSEWNSPPQKLDDRPRQTWIFALWRAPVLSKLKKSGKSEVCLAEEERQNFLAAA